MLTYGLRFSPFYARACLTDREIFFFVECQKLKKEKKTSTKYKFWKTFWEKNVANKIKTALRHNAVIVKSLPVTISSFTVCQWHHRCLRSSLKLILFQHLLQTNTKAVSEWEKTCKAKIEHDAWVVKNTCLTHPAFAGCPMKYFTLFPIIISSLSVKSVNYFRFFFFFLNLLML